MKNKYVCIHGHFYQPPRENPWLNEVEMQDSAYPYHDWNHRITAECYARNSASRFVDDEGRILQIINNYSRMSFNFGPTLLEWMEKNSLDVYEAILQADKESQKRFNGHGSAIAQVYNHMIMPLANERDKRTQIKWGIKDFERRFGRFPEGMWLGESAVDTPTLEILAEYGIKYTILSPYQAKRYRLLAPEKHPVEEPEHDKKSLIVVSGMDVKEVAIKPKKGSWYDATNAKIDPRNSYLCRLPSGKSINLFFYDGPISQAIAFERLLDNGETFAQRLLKQVQENNDVPKMINIATDGETYGHHHRFGEMGLTYCLHTIDINKDVKLTIYGEFLENHPPEYEVEIVENSSWSCYHGVERWRSNCGCNTGGRQGWDQAWRKPLRDAFNWLRDNLIPIYEKQMKKYVDDPWKIRDEYINLILDRSDENVDHFFYKYVPRRLNKVEQTEFLKLLEMQYHSMLMYTSCGWFFDEVTGIETMQDIMYAARAMQLAGEVGNRSFELGFLKILSEAKSNIPELENAAVAYEKFVKPAIVDLHRVGAHYAISSIFSEYPEKVHIYSYTTEAHSYDLQEAGKYKLAIGKALLRSNITREEHMVTFAVLYLGDHHIFGGVREFENEFAFKETKRDIQESFNKSNVHEIILLMDKHFGAHSYSFWHLFKDDQKRIINQVLEHTSVAVENMLSQLYENNYLVIQAVKELSIPLPNPLKIPLDFVVNSKLKRILEHEIPDFHELNKIINEIQKLSVGLDTLTLNYISTLRITSLMEQLFEDPEDVELMKRIVELLKMLKRIPLTLDLWKSENICFLIRRIYYEGFSYRSERGDEKSQTWISLFKTLYENLNMKM
jgi:alpha-amylase/alpha-mannosidase (GH57 family)